MKDSKKIELAKTVINETQRKKITEAIADLVWMARRYSNGRLTGAPSIFNDSYDTLRDFFGPQIDAKRFSHQGSEETFYDISIETSNEHPYALYGDGHDTQSNNGIPHRPYFGKEKK